MRKTKKIFFIHFKDENGFNGNYKPVQSYTKKEARKYFESFEKYKNCKILSIN